MESTSIDKVISSASGIYESLKVILSIAMNKEESEELEYDFYNNMIYFISNIFLPGKMTLNKLKFMNHLFKMDFQSCETLGEFIPKIILESENIGIPSYFKTIVKYDLNNNKTVSETFRIILNAFGVVAYKATERISPEGKGRYFIKRYIQSLEAYHKYQISLLSKNDLP